MVINDVFVRCQIANFPYNSGHGKRYCVTWGWAKNAFRYFRRSCGKEFMFVCKSGKRA